MPVERMVLCKVLAGTRAAWRRPAMAEALKSPGIDPPRTLFATDDNTVLRRHTAL
jgi:hypothetical protein